MRKTFPGYYLPTGKEFTELWDKCLFVLDASVLLNLYRYSSETGEEFLQILQHVSERLWIPYQAAFEYQRNRLSVIAKQWKAYTEIEDVLVKTRDRLTSDLGEYNRHPLIHVEGLTKRIERLLSKITKELRAQKGEHPDLLAHDSIRDKVTSLLEGNVGIQYPRKRLEEIFEESAARYDRNVPPGFLDARTKEGEEKFGDLVLWFQIIDKAKDAKKPIIFVTDDTKEDWWWKFQGKTIGPRPELIQEVREKADVLFYMYRPDRFMEYTREYLSQKIDQKAIDEIRSIGQEREEAIEELVQFVDKLDVVTKMLDIVVKDRQRAERRVNELAEKITQMITSGLEDDEFKLHEEFLKLRTELAHAEAELSKLREQEKVQFRYRRDLSGAQQDIMRLISGRGSPE